MRRDAERLLDEYLAASARAGDPRAFERLAARWQPKLLGHAWRLTGETDLARDVVQDAWVQIMRCLARLDDTAAFPAWAFRIVTRRAAKSIRERQKGRRLAEAHGAFRGRRGWVIWLIFIAQAIMFLVGVYLAWRFFQVEDVMVALRYGLSALLMFIMGAILKSGMGRMIEGNRVIREVKRLELQIARDRARRAE